MGLLTRSKPQSLVALPALAKAAVMPGHEHQIPAYDLRWRDHGRRNPREERPEAARKAAREADRAEAEAISWDFR